MFKRSLFTALTVFIAAVMSFAAFCVNASALTAPVLTKTSLTLAVGDKYQIYVNNAVDTIKWSSSDSKTAGVSKGLVTAKKAGTVTITAKHGSVSLKCRVTVKANAKKYTFRTKDLYDEHYKKHGAEFGKITQSEYLTLANELINSGSSNVLHKTEDDGDKLFFDKETGYFAVLSKDGYIRTCFVPDSGIKYWEKQ